MFLPDEAIADHFGLTSRRTFPTFILATDAISEGDAGAPISAMAASTVLRSAVARTSLTSPAIVQVQVSGLKVTAFSSSGMSRPRPYRISVPPLSRFSTRMVSGAPVKSQGATDGVEGVVGVRLAQMVDDMIAIRMLGRQRAQLQHRGIIGVVLRLFAPLRRPHHGERVDDDRRGCVYGGEPARRKSSPPSVNRGMLALKMQPCRPRAVHAHEPGHARLQARAGCLPMRSTTPRRPMQLISPSV